MTAIREDDLVVSFEPKKLMRRITQCICRTLELEDILSTVVVEVRSLLRTDRVMIYKFHSDESGQVIAESINEYRLPSLLGLNFPADDIPLNARKLFLTLRMRSVVNVESREIGQIPLHDIETKDIYYRPVDPCHVEYLRAMGVNSSFVTPILDQDQLWGLLVSHHCEPRSVEKHELEILQMVVEQLSIAIAQNTLLRKAREKGQREAIINRIATLLHSIPNIEVKLALEEAVAAFGGSGGRLCLRNPTSDFLHSLVDTSYLQLYTCGAQPIIPDTTVYSLIEQSNIWQEHYKFTKDVWAISDIYKTPALENLQIAFKPTQIRSLLMIPIIYRQELLGYLSIFRDQVDTETFWAGKNDPDQRQSYPRHSFDVWRELKQAQAQEWTSQEIELAQELGKQFAMAMYEFELYEQVHSLNATLENQVQERTAKLQETTEQLTQALHNLKLAQTQLIQTEKMSSLGQLVAGIAHEINNPVNFIYGNINHVSQYAEDLLSMLLLYRQQCQEVNPQIIQRAEEIDLDFLIEDLPKMLSSMKIGVDRIRQIVLSLRTFSRFDQAEIKPVDIHQGIDSTLLILQHRLKAKPENPAIEIIKNYGKLPLVECYAGQLNQVFMNLLTNAIDALEDSSAVDKPQIRICTEISNTNRIIIQIADNGSGIPDAVTKRMFDPFFTTKSVGKGTGLGLSISYQIVVEKHRGSLRCESQPGLGTEFFIEIPVQQTN